MLGKLAKYEWKYIWKKYLLFIGLLLAGTIIGLLSGQMIATVDDANDFGRVLVGMSGFMLYYTILIGVSTGFSVIIAIRFYKKVYGEQGYLTHTLPVSARQIYLSHLIVYGICLLGSTILTMFSVMAVTNCIFTGILSTSEMNALEGAVPPTMFGMNMFGVTNPGEGIILCLYFIAAQFLSLSMIYASIVLGQYWKRFKIWGAILSYLIMQSVLVVASWIVTIPYMVGRIMQGGPTKQVTVLDGSFWGIMLVLSVVFGVIAFLIMDHGMVKKLNLE